MSQVTDEMVDTVCRIMNAPAGKPFAAKIRAALETILPLIDPAGGGEGKAVAEHRCTSMRLAEGEFSGGAQVRCKGVWHTNGNVTETCGEPCRWIMQKSGEGDPPWTADDLAGERGVSPDRVREAANATATPALTLPPSRDSEKLIEALGELERAIPDAFWHIAKGRLTENEPLFAALVLFGDKEIGNGESDISASDAVRIATVSAIRALERTSNG